MGKTSFNGLNLVLELVFCVKLYVKNIQKKEGFKKCILTFVSFIKVFRGIKIEIMRNV